MNWKIFYQPLRVSTYTFLMKCWDYISLIIMLIILGLIITFFVKETIRNCKHDKCLNNFNAEKYRKMRLEEEKEKLNKFLKKQEKAVMKVRNL